MLLYFFPPTFNATFGVAICFFVRSKTVCCSLKKKRSNNTQYCGKMRMKLDKYVANAAQHHWNRYRLLLPISFTV